MGDRSLTSHDLMRKAMADHAITAVELIEHIHREIGGDRHRIAAAVSRFLSGGPGGIAVHVAIIDLVVQQERATVH
jgi:hypothetical protein